MAVLQKHKLGNRNGVSWLTERILVSVGKSLITRGELNYTQDKIVKDMGSLAIRLTTTYVGNRVITSFSDSIFETPFELSPELITPIENVNKFLIKTLHRGSLIKIKSPKNRRTIKINPIL